MSKLDILAFIISTVWRIETPFGTQTGNDNSTVTSGTFKEKKEWRDPVPDAQDTHGNVLSLNAVLDRYLNSSMVIQKFSAKTNKWYQLKEKL